MLRRLKSAVLLSVFVLPVVLYTFSSSFSVHKTVPVPVHVAAAAELSASTAPNQQLPPGAIKHPGEKCATVIQPPDGQGCPGPPNNTVNGQPWCSGAAQPLGECLAAEQGFFNPPVNFQPRNSTEQCINAREHGGSYGPGGDNGGRWQFMSGTWRSNGGQADWGNASPPEQDWIFVRTVAASGYSNWRPYDGC